MKIELLRQADLELVQRLVQLDKAAFGQGGMNEWQLVPLIRHGRVFTALRQGEIAGCVQYMLDWDNPRSAYMVGVAMDEKVRGRGLGTEFIKQTLQILADEGLAAVELTVSLENTAAIRVYETKLGFARTTIRRDEYGAGEHRVVMTVSLENFAGRKE
ncbi:GNAT family N-acetyltransferase|uniref:Ribosomal-protein-alanine N-acetyltransferase n=1 Tax=Dendrosporobacter quercicolus TaxID=146817 RepID=A0A1G9W6X9_9FIRM|nr:GNAT family N-acetyltransferase [Dendrosporobacter quercicolus]NSL47701.1 GNAT family N-acetyltransferase [Dendrosporobacter quercicolus DSM 1736]SDM80249.1 ribosomal-protein-alanine N-acetyltransferase [Dendrosporobacter quercicolus]